MNYAESVVDLVGNTPLVKLGTVAREAGVRATVLAKVEYFNPGGSVKDRIALKMIEAAEASGELKPGGTIVEPTSGNTGVGLALVAQRKGYRCIFVCPDKVAKDKMDVLRAYGAQVVSIGLCKDMRAVVTTHEEEELRGRGFRCGDARGSGGGRHAPEAECVGDLRPAWGDLAGRVLGRRRRPAARGRGPDRALIHPA